MAIERVKEYFNNFGMEHRIVVLDKSSATVDLAAEALGCTPSRIAKSLSFKLDEKVILVVASGDTRVDNKKYKDKFGKRPKMLKFEETEELIGHAAGGVCPFAVNENVHVYLDESLRRFETVYPAAGSCDSLIELSIEELDNYSNNIEWVDVCVGR